MDQRSGLAVGGKTPHAVELDRSTPEDYERLKLFGACLTQQAVGSNGARHGTTPDPTATAVRLFLHWSCRSAIGAPSRTLPQLTAAVVETGKG
jgi:hypothetical protein